uniref:Reverse transcriptase domain-containing protein n=1 Tax=Tanacetum cinerariifolium TaxID=118510 RepID=A0A6L2KPA6_TANCI|nr:hypothetical protein [Tanacetum cinerariifolium]
MITVLTNSPIKQTLTKPKKSGRVTKWAIELGEHDIVFQARGDKTPNDFLIEVPLEDNEKKVEEKADTKSTTTELSYEWKLFTDGAMNSDSSGDGNYKPGNLHRLSVAGKSNKMYLRSQTTNDQRIITEHQRGFEGLRQLHDQAYLKEPKQKADALSKLASMTFEHLTKEVLVEVLPKRSIEDKEILQVEIKEGESWMTPIYEYLVSDLLPEDPKESKNIRVPMALIQNHDQWWSGSRSKGITGHQCTEMLQSLEDIMRQVATLHLNIDKQVKDLRLHMILCLMKRIKESESKSSKSLNMMGDYAPYGSLRSLWKPTSKHGIRYFPAKLTT